MEVEKGYKKTEVGVIPDNWGVRLLKDLANIQRGASPRPIGAPIWYDRTSKIGWVRISDVSASDGKYLRNTRDYLSEKGISQSRYLPAGSLIMSICATVGMPVITQINSCYHDGFVGFTNLRYVDQNFLYYKLKELEPSFKLMGQTGSQNNLNSNIVRGCPISLPPILEQRAIAAALSDLDALLAAMDAIIAKKGLIKQGAMQELLTEKKRLPGFSGVWKLKAFSDLVTVRKQKIDPRIIGNSLFCVELEHIDQGTGKLLGFTETDYTTSIKSIFRKGDILFGKLRAYLRKYWLADRNGVCTTEIWPFISNRSVVLPGYLFQLIQTNGFIEVASVAYGTHMPRTDWNVVKNYKFPIPSIPEQQAIANVLTDMDAEIAALEQKREKTRLLKLGMMQELLTGRIRLG